MRTQSRQVQLLVLLCLLVVLGAQFHFCADLKTGPSAPHLCPVCSATGSILTTDLPEIAVEPVEIRFEAVRSLAAQFSAVPRATSPRAPPAL